MTAAASMVADERAGEEDLWRALRDYADAEARQHLFEQYSGFATSIARRLAPTLLSGGVEFDDLRQFAFTGLLEAIDRFDPALGVPFKGFAAHRVTGSIRDGVARMTEVGEQLSWRSRVRRERMRSLSGRDGERGPARNAMEELIEIAAGLALGFMIEDTTLFHDGAHPERTPAPPSAYDSLAWKELVTRLRSELDTLPPRERLIVTQHYTGGVAFDQIALMLGLSKGRVSQIHGEALQRLRKRMAGSGHFRLEG